MVDIDALIEDVEEEYSHFCGILSDLIWRRLRDDDEIDYWEVRRELNNTVTPWSTMELYTRTLQKILVDKQEKSC